MFRSGQKVQCIRDGVSRFSGQPTVVRRGAVYTVKRCWINSTWNHPVVTLEEVDPPAPSFSFDAERFRPLIERKTDIGFAYEILRKVTKQDRVRV